jgi:hypothetical protein
MSAYWGPRLWYLLHTFSVKIELIVDNRALWGNFLKVSLAVMNCPKCQSHFSEALRGLNLKVITKAELEEWFYNLHNEINQTNIKPLFSAEEWAAEKAKPTDKERLAVVINELSAHFLQNERTTHLNAGSSRIWRILANRFTVQL